MYFLKDVDGFLKTDVDYNQDDALEWAKKEFIPSLIKESIRQWARYRHRWTWWQRFYVIRLFSYKQNDSRNLCDSFVF
ncbi:MAG: hypothetical protein OXC03_07355 [Flavobacteriaceae bacterium]|nr:hypothetical protein [Flavobacteriaceae bacterium]